MPGRRRRRGPGREARSTSPTPARPIVAARPGRVLSIAAGVTLATLEAGSATCPSCGPCPTRPRWSAPAPRPSPPGRRPAPADLEWAEAVLGSVGLVVRVTEKALDAVTGLSGSGPAYVFLVAEAMVDAGVLVGLDRATSAALTRQTLLGAARMLAESAELPEALRAAVTSPGGTTAAGLRVLEQRAVRAAFLDAVAAATERSRELGAPVRAIGTLWRTLGPERGEACDAVAPDEVDLRHGR